MGRENILKYQLEHDHESDLVTEKDQSLLLDNNNNLNGMNNTIKTHPVRVSSGNHNNFPFTLSSESTLQDFLNNNKFFVDSIKHNHGNQIFDLNGQGQSPHTLWIGVVIQEQVINV